jgi:hypothetical protein
MKTSDMFYEVQGAGDGTIAVIFQGNNILDEIPAVSEKQAHFLARESYPDAQTPAQRNLAANADYNSRAGRAWRRNNPQ